MSEKFLASGLLALPFAGCIEYQPTGPVNEWPSSSPPPAIVTTHTDKVLQVTTPEVDILWVVDDSCSMGDDQDSLTANFPAFMLFFGGSGLDYHIGVTSTDTTGSGLHGRLSTVGGARWIDDETDNAEQVFSQMARLGTTGSSYEKGLDGCYSALEEEVDEYNDGFYRDAASIHTIIVSDEPDFSSPPTPVADEFVEWYDELKPEEEMRSFSTIVDPQIGREYVNVSIDLENGVQWSILDDDWVTVLELLGVQASGLRREYFLSHLPTPDSITVSIAQTDGNVRELVEGEGNKGDWTYSATRNSIELNEIIPPPLSEIVIDYTLLSAIQEEDVTETIPE